MGPHKWWVVALFVVRGFGQPVSAQEFPQTPLERTGRHTTGEEALEFVRELEARSDRVRVEMLGESGAQRPLVQVVVTEAARHREDPTRGGLRAGYGRLRSEPGSPVPPDLPVSVWFCMSVHGDEASGVEAGLRLIRQMALGDDPTTLEVLRHVVLHVELVANPDGYARFVQGVRDRSSGVVQADREAYDHRQPWPSGRFNHRNFDLNRDWFLQTQPESRGRVARILKELPQVLCDFHEMGSDQSYYFSAPPGDPTNHHTTPEVRSLWRRLGAEVASAFDGARRPYWTGDIFPADYPGYGGSWPSLLGTASFTFEQGSAGAGAVRRDDGTVHTLEDAVRGHELAGLAILRRAARDRREILETVAEHFRRVAREGDSDPRPWIILTPERDPGTAVRLMDVLAANGVSFAQLQESITLEGTDLEGGASSSRTVPAGSWVINTRQPARPLLLALLDPEVRPEPRFLDEEVRRRDEGEPSEIYDITAWNLPWLFDVMAFRAASLPADVRWGEPSARDASATAGENPVAWLASARGFGGVATLPALLRAGARIRVVPFAFTADGVSFGPGTLVAWADRNTDPEVQRLFQTSGAWRGARSFETSDGHDLGSSRTQPVQVRRLVVAYGEGTSATGAGSALWFLEEVLRWPSLRVALKDLPTVLRSGDMLLLPDGAYPDFPTAAVRSFVESGGQVVAVRGAVSALADQKLLDLSGEEGSDAGSIPGVIVRTRSRSGHPLCVGVPTDPPALVRTNRGFRAGSSVDVALEVAPRDSVSSGILGPAEASRLPGRLLVGSQNLGSGSIAFFAEDPTFRGITPGMWRLFVNALLLRPPTR